MTDLELYLRSKPWWDSRFMWGAAAGLELIKHAIWHSSFTRRDIAALGEDDLA